MLVSCASKSHEEVEILKNIFFSRLAACNLNCRQGMTYKPFGRVKDGTRCQADPAGDNRDICIGGQCMVWFPANLLFRSR